MLLNIFILYILGRISVTMRNRSVLRIHNDFFLFILFGTVLILKILYCVF